MSFRSHTARTPPATASSNALSGDRGQSVQRADAASGALMTPKFPAAMRAINALAPIHARSPNQVAHVARILEEAMQAYGRCLLASAGSPVTAPHTATDGRVVHPQPRETAVREAETHMLWRERLRASVEALRVVQDETGDRALGAACREIDHLAYTIDRVLAARGVHCVAVASGTHS